ELHGLREREAMLWLAQHEPDIETAPWCALDDAPGNWLTRSRLVLTDFKRGFIEEDADALRRMLNGFREGLPDNARPRSMLRWA
ncbi:MAG: HAD domain-containing protein, partial [Ramlibacter sp.]|nr:HAD domain-containing protein [Ramlibacter sp.]